MKMSHVPFPALTFPERPPSLPLLLQLGQLLARHHPRLQLEHRRGYRQRAMLPGSGRALQCGRRPSLFPMSWLLPLLLCAASGFEGHGVPGVGALRRGPSSPRPTGGLLRLKGGEQGALLPLVRSPLMYQVDARITTREMSLRKGEPASVNDFTDDGACRDACASHGQSFINACANCDADVFRVTVMCTLARECPLTSSACRAGRLGGGWVRCHLPDGRVADG